jgi:cysteinylglycine-S-conjugate dipeptidase
VIIWGAEDTAKARIHGSDESVDLGELERMVLAEALLIAGL